ncbi:MAG TPA: acyl-CoA dehydrogenase family protein, partial [Stellaceae bacterium]|nr:acyl-CoA dehydrogenase family protein [Stellaceae bacterium]
MDIGFSDEQVLLRDTARKFLDAACTTKFVRERMATPEAMTPEFWGRMAEQGWLGINFAEDDGGIGLGLVDLVVLMEEMGRAVMPGPYLATVLLGGAAIRGAGSAAQRQTHLPRIAVGEIRATLAATEPNARWDASGIMMNAQPMRGGFSLSGTKLFVPDAH